MRISMCGVSSSHNTRVVGREITKQGLFSVTFMGNSVLGSGELKKCRLESIALN
jgi:hypothetical protein